MCYRPGPLAPTPCHPQASSPDEEALVQGAAYAGYRLLRRGAESVELEYHGMRYLYHVLTVLEFTSERKRMSIICRCVCTLAAAAAYNYL